MKTEEKADHKEGRSCGDLSARVVFEDYKAWMEEYRRHRSPAPTTMTFAQFQEQWESLDGPSREHFAARFKMTYEELLQSEEEEKARLAEFARQFE